MALSILLAQIRPSLGNFSYNTEKIIKIVQENQSNYDIIVFPELSLTGYSPEDLLLHDSFRKDIQTYLDLIQKQVKECVVIVGHPSLAGKNNYNSASVFKNEKCIALYHKQQLPNYGVFDEKRYFIPGSPVTCTIKVKEYKIGILICEDVWHSTQVDLLVNEKVAGVLVLNASPFEIDKAQRRIDLLKKHAKKGIWLTYVNLVGGQDEVVFDGQSFAVDAKAKLCAKACAFNEELLPINIDQQTITGNINPALSPTALIYEALKSGLKEYLRNNNFTKVILGLSGGIDSALTLAIACDTLGSENVTAVLMPSKFTAAMSTEDALQQVKSLGANYEVIPINDLYELYLTSLPQLKQFQPDITEENLQARIRANILMALSNKTKKLLITTSNKSEIAVGYSTLYGDMAGGFCVLKDVLKTEVYNLAHFRNSISAVIPQRVIERAPSAELRENQADQDHLPNYDVLDQIIKAYVIEKLDVKAIINLGLSKSDVELVLKLIKQSEYKRRQSPIGTKISHRAFGREWRYPINSNYYEKI